MIKVLEISAGLDGGGVDRILYDYCTRMMSEVHFDFAIVNARPGILEKPLISMGSKIYHVPQMRGNFKEYYRQLSQIIAEGKYDVVHDNTNHASGISLYIAKKHGVPIRIAHAHTRNFSESFSKRFRRFILTILSKNYATNLFACCKDAATWMWGNSAYYSGNVYIMKNAISLKEFEFSLIERERLRNELNINDKFVIGNVARLSEEKNHEFLIQVFKKIHESCPESVLVLIGRGEAEEKVRAQVSNLGLRDSVIFLGIRNDVSKLLNVMDVFVLPSIYEGLPVTLVEAQANGLPIVASDAITEEIKLSNNFKFLSIKSSQEFWATEIIKLKNSRTKMDNRILEYDIDKESKKLITFFKNGLRK